MKKFSKCMAVLATLSLVFSLFFACKQSSDDDEPQVQIEEISLQPVNSNRVFTLGNISEDDFIVTAKYSDGTSELLKDEVTFTGLDSSTAGAVKITAKYGKFEASCVIFVISSDDLKYDESEDGKGNTIKLTGITLSLKDKNKTFFEGDKISAADFTVTAKYDDNSEKTVSDGVIFTGGSESLSAGFVTVRAQYGSASAAFKIPVVKKNSKNDVATGANGSEIKLTGITLSLKESNKKFTEGDKVLKTDLVVTAKYDDGSAKDVSDGVSFIGTDEELDVGKTTLWATYGSKVTSLEISVLENPKIVKLVSVSLALKENKTFVVGDTMSASDFTVTAKYSDDTSKTVTEKDGVQFIGLKTTERAGEVEVSVIYFENSVSKSANTVITVSEKNTDVVTLDSISIALKDSNETFVEGDAISASDFIVTAKYSNGTSEAVTTEDGVKFTGLGTAEKAGEVTVTVTYLSKTESLKVTVIEKIVDDPESPDALYIVGEFNNWAGFVPMEKAGQGCFYYSFSKDDFDVASKTKGRAEFKITASEGWNEQVFIGVEVPSTGVYVASFPFENGSEGNAIIEIKNPEDKVLVRNKDKIWYARYVAAGEVVNPNEEMEIKPNFELKMIPRYGKVGDTLKAEVAVETVPFDYVYQWYRCTKVDEGVPVDATPIGGATSKTSPQTEEEYYYYCLVTAVSKNTGDKITKGTSLCYIDSDDEVKVTLLFGEFSPISTVTLTSENDATVIKYAVSTPYYDYIEWKCYGEVVKIIEDRYRKLTISAVEIGETMLTATVIRNGEPVATTSCKIVVEGLGEKAEWWYYELDTSQVSSKFVNLIFNAVGGVQTEDIEVVQLTGEIAFSLSPATFSYSEIKVDDSMRQGELDTAEKLVVYVYVPNGRSSLNIYSWSTSLVEVEGEEGPLLVETAINLAGEWPGTPMNKCK